MPRHPRLAERAEALLGRAVVATSPIAGGDIATATRLRLSDGTTALMKSITSPPQDFFVREAAGLRWLGEVTDGVEVPEVLAAEQDCLILSWVESAKATPEAGEAFGVALAATHAATVESFGGEVDGFIGRLPLPNRTADSWGEFYAVRRVLPYLKLARDRDAIGPEDAAAIEQIVPRLPTLVPDEAPARLHGDLWNGNVIWGPEGAMHVIDPAAYAGHREMDLAMMALFGLPHLQKVLAAYDDAHPLAEGWEDRVWLHQIFPLLVHACMFGGTYGKRAAEMARRYH